MGLLHSVMYEKLYATFALGFVLKNCMGLLHSVLCEKLYGAFAPSAKATKTSS